MVELKNCPCCGCAANAWDIHTQMNRTGYRMYKYVSCYGCGLKTKPYPTEEEAAEAWNRRTPEEAGGE